MIRIVNQREVKYNPEIPYHTKIDRSSVLGNPYKIKDYGSRDKVCDMYNERLVEKLTNHMKGKDDKEADKIVKELVRLSEVYHKYGMLNLYCWCDTDSQRCHGEVLIKVIEELKTTR